MRVQSYVAGRWVKVPAEEVEWGLTPGSGGLSGLPTDEKQPEVGLEMADRFLHHVPWEYRGQQTTTFADFGTC